MVVLRCSVLKVLSVLMSLLLVWVLSVDPVLMDLRGTLRNAMVSDQSVCSVSIIMVIKCVDIDECAQNNTICSQVCVNTRGDYVCSCFDGYQLIEGTNQCEGM